MRILEWRKGFIRKKGNENETNEDGAADLIGKNTVAGKASFCKASNLAIVSSKSEGFTESCFAAGFTFFLLVK